MKTWVVGLTGAMGSGKSTVSCVFKTLGIPVYNSDEKAKELYDTNEFREKLYSVFGAEVFDANGIPDKKKIAQRVFQDKTSLHKLNALIHPYIKDDFRKWTKRFPQAPYVIQESAILYEAGFDTLFDKIISVHAEVSVILARIQKRDGLSEEQIHARLDNQMPIEEKKKRADFVIINNESQLVLPQILAIHEQLIRAAEK